MKTFKICVFLLFGLGIQSNIFAQTCRDINFLIKNGTQVTYQLQPNTNKGNFPSTLPSGTSVGSVSSDSGISSLVLLAKNENQPAFEINVYYNTCASDQVGQISINPYTSVLVGGNYNKDNATVTIEIKNFKK